MNQQTFIGDAAARDLITVPTPGEQLPVVIDNAATSHADKIIELIRYGMDRGQSPEALEKLVALQERVMAKRAEQEFAAAMQAFQSDCAIVGKNRTAKIKTKTGGDYSYGFADLAHVAETIKPYCDRHGFSYSFNQKSDKGTIEVTCVVRHVGGHREQTTFSGPTDTAAAMSDMQKSGAATTFARRYALVLAFGLSIGEDTDARPLHDNPSENPDAPQVKPRGERQPQVVSSKQLADMCRLWADAFNGGTFVKALFREWVGKKLNAANVEFIDGWNWEKAEQWTERQYAVCLENLP